MRQYLLNEKKIGRKLKAEIVLAESANQIYRDTTYADLITFEEDIARISAMVLVIAESAGSLAELGAFSSNITIRNSLAIVMQEKYAEAESFIRYGPVERIRNDDIERVGFFPWRINKNNRIVKNSAQSHVTSIIDFINGRLDRVPKTTGYSSSEDIRDFIVLYWVIFLSFAITLSKLTSYIKNIIPGMDQGEVRKKLYCMQLAGWVNKKHYSNLDYYFCCYDDDPFDYKFNVGVVQRDSLRRKTDVLSAIQKDLSLPKYIRQIAAKSRKKSKK